MCHGITKIDSKIKKGEIIEIADEKNHKSLAIGKAMFDSKEMKAKPSGKVIKISLTINDTDGIFILIFKN